MLRSAAEQCRRGGLAMPVNDPPPPHTAMRRRRRRRCLHSLLLATTTTLIIMQKGCREAQASCACDDAWCTMKPSVWLVITACVCVFFFVQFDSVRPNC